MVPPAGDGEGNTVGVPLAQNSVADAACRRLINAEVKAHGLYNAKLTSVAVFSLTYECGGPRRASGQEVYLRVGTGRKGIAGGPEVWHGDPNFSTYGQRSITLSRRTVGWTVVHGAESNGGRLVMCTVSKDIQRTCTASST